MNQKDIEHLAQGFPPSHIGKDHEEVVTELAKHALELQQKLDAVLADNVALKNGIGFFSYGSDSGFEEHDSAEKAIASADSDIDYYRGDACDGWSEETDRTVWGVILQRATMINERPLTEEDSHFGSHISSVCDYALLPNLATPATDALLNTVRADAIDEFGRYHNFSGKLLIQDEAKKYAEKLRTETDTTPSQYESLAGGK